VISPEIRLTPSVGHTPGHVSVMIESEGERAVITGDMAHHPWQMAHPDWTLADVDPKVAALTRSRLFAEWADQPILVIGTHFAARPPPTSSATAQRSGLRCEGGPALCLLDAVAQQNYAAFERLRRNEAQLPLIRKQTRPLAS